MTHPNLSLPWSMSTKQSDAVICVGGTSVSPDPGFDDVEHFGGAFVCESVAGVYRQAICSLPDLLQLLRDLHADATRDKANRAQPFLYEPRIKEIERLIAKLEPVEVKG